MELEIPLGISCEVQVRTLLQHAHSELTHDTIYKPKTTARPEIRRTVAKSMALIEATDEFFEQAMKNLDEAANKQRQLMGVLAELYETGVGASPGFERSNQILIDCFMEGLPPPPFSEIRQYLDSKAFIFDRVKERLGNRHFFGQLSVLLAYYLVDTAPAVTQQNWPLDVDDLATVFSDLGKKYAS